MYKTLIAVCAICLGCGAQDKQDIAQKKDAAVVTTVAQKVDAASQIKVKPTRRPNPKNKDIYRRRISTNFPFKPRKDPDQYKFNFSAWPAPLPPTPTNKGTDRVGYQQ